MTLPTDMEAVIQTAQLAATADGLDPNELYGITVPNGAGHKVIDLEKYLDNPRRTRGHVSVHDTTSLVAYLTKHGAPDPLGPLSIYADITASTITAVLNGHDVDTTGTTGDPGCVGEAGWGDHRVSYTLKKTPEWVRWLSLDRKWIDQETFAIHIDESIPDILTPPAADMLELAQTLQVKKDIDFKSQTLIGNGQRQFGYEETVAAKAGAKGNLTIPGVITLGIKPYEGMVAAYKFAARFQFRLHEGDLKFKYLLDRPEEILRTAFDEIVAEVENGTGLGALRGVAPSALQ